MFNDKNQTAMSDNTNSAHGFTEGSEFKTETKGMEGELKSLHHKLYDQIVMIPNGVKFLVAVNEGIEELKSLRSELQKAKEKEIRGDRMIVDLEHQKCVLKSDLSKAKELNGELVGYLKRIMTREIFKEHFNIEQVEELIKKSEI